MNYILVLLDSFQNFIQRMEESIAVPFSFFFFVGTNLHMSVSKSHKKQEKTYSFINSFFLLTICVL